MPPAETTYVDYFLRGLMVLAGTVVVGVVFSYAKHVPTDEQIAAQEAQEAQEQFDVAVEKCMPGFGSVGIHEFGCTGDVFNATIGKFLEAHPSLEPGSVVPISDTVWVGDSGTVGYTILFRQKR